MLEEQLCILCEHRARQHDESVVYDGLKVCNPCYPGNLKANEMAPSTHPCYHKFNDNLTYIENFAEQRGLI